jgi:hypothetical protein
MITSEHQRISILCDTRAHADLVGQHYHRLDKLRQLIYLLAIALHARLYRLAG